MRNDLSGAALIVAIVICLMLSIDVLAQSSPPVENVHQLADDDHWSGLFAGEVIRSAAQIAVDGDQTYIAGEFDLEEGFSTGILLWNTSTGAYELICGVWHASYTCYGFDDMLIADGVLYVAHRDGNGRSVVGSRDSSSGGWQTLGSPFDERVVALGRATGGDLIALRSSSSEFALLTWNGDTWESLAPAGIGSASALATGPNGVFVAVHEPDKPGPAIRLWSEMGWSTIGNLSDHAPVIGAVMDLAIGATGDLYVAGQFKRVDTVDVNNFARWDGNRWYTIHTGAQGPFTWIRDITLDGNDIFVAGHFHDESGVRRHAVVHIEDESATVLGVASNEVRTVAATSAGLMASGLFTSMNGNILEQIGIYDHDSGWRRPLPSRGNGLSHNVSTLVFSHDGALFAGGGFRWTADGTVSHVAQWNGRAWRPVADGLAGAPNVLMFSGDTLYAGGAFDFSDQNTGLAFWARGDNAWTYPHADQAGLRITSVEAMVTHGGHLVVAGTFLQNEMEGAGVLEYDGQQWNVIGEMRRSQYNSPPIALVSASDGKLIATGDFSRVNDLDAKHVASWDGSTWREIENDFDAGITSATEHKGRLVVASSERNDLWTYDAANASWEQTVTPLVWSGDCAPGVKTLHSSRDGLYVGGGVSLCLTGDSAAGSTSSLFLWDGEDWFRPGSGVDGEVNAIATLSDDVFVGGNFRSAGDKSSRNVGWFNTQVAIPVEQFPVPEPMEDLVNYPNPFNASTTLAFDVEDASHVRVVVYDLQGRRLDVLLDTNVGPGRHEIIWRADGQSAGVYFVRLEINDRPTLHRPLVRTH